MPESRPSQTAQEPRSALTRIKATPENRPICAAIAVRSWDPGDAKNAPLRVEKRLRPVVPMGRNRVGPLPRNRVVPFRRNQVGPISRNPALWTAHALLATCHTAASDRSSGATPQDRQAALLAGSALASRQWLAQRQANWPTEYRRSRWIDVQQIM